MTIGSKFIPVSKPSISALEIEYVTDAVKSTWISSLGEYINKFENTFADFCEVKHAIAVSNGTVAIQLLLSALGIKTGDEVIVPDFTFIATANAVLHAGAKPVFADIQKDTLCLDPMGLENMITEHTKAIMPVHVYGHPADMSKINNIAEKHNLIVIEDAAEAHGARFKNRPVGSLARAACFSFYGNKNLTTGEGGMITTDDEELAKKCRFLRDQAMSSDKRYWHPEPGFNFRITNLQAAIGCAQMERKDKLLKKRKTLFEWYSNGINNVPGLRLNHSKTWAENSYWMICLEFEEFDEESRKAFMEYLKDKNIDSRPYFYPCSMMPYYDRIDNPVTYSIFSKGINLPTYFDLEHEEVIYICQMINQYFANI